MESARYAGFAAGPLLAGGLAAAGGTRAALLVNAASFLAVAAAGRLLHARRPPAPGHGAERDRARDGIAALWDDGVLRIVVGAAVAALLFISASLTVEVFYAKDVLEAGDTGYALLTVAWMAGMIAGATGLPGMSRSACWRAARSLRWRSRARAWPPRPPSWRSPSPSRATSWAVSATV